MKTTQNQRAWWVGNIDDPANIDKSLTCNNCGGHGLAVFYRKEKIPVHSCLMMSTAEEARKFPTGDLALGFCRKCGFITNTVFDSTVQDYTTVYEDQQSFSPTFNAFARNLAQSLIDKYQLRGKRIVEIGCSKGDFLIMMCGLGENEGLGIDPTAIPGRVQGEGASRVNFIQDYYSEKYADQAGDMIICRHTLEHIHDPFRFVDIIRKSLKNHPNTIVFFEVPDIVRVLKEQAFWDIYYEHCSYFSLGSLARLFRRCGFGILDLACEYDNQYLIIDTRPANNVSDKRHPLEESPETMASHVREFAEKCDARLRSWHDYLRQAKAEGKKLVAWGSGSKCVSFFTTLGLTDEIAHIVDINPHRQGRYIVGACKEVKPPKFLQEYQPDVVIAMNPIYQDEIKAMLAEMGLAPEIKAV